MTSTGAPLDVGQVSEAEWLGWVAMTARLAGWRVAVEFESASAFPNLVAVRGEQVVFARCKRQRGDVSDAQQAWLSALETAGREVHVWRPSDHAEVLARLLPSKETS